MEDIRRDSKNQRDVYDSLAKEEEDKKKGIRDTTSSFNVTSTMCKSLFFLQKCS
jgi:hypothetical protein